MPIVVAHQPNAAVLSGAANMAGLGQFRQRQEDIALKQAAMAQDDIQQQRSIAARQQEQVFGAQQQMMQNAQQRAMQLFMLQQNQGFDQQNQQRQFEQQRALQEGSARNQQEYLGAQLNKQKEYADYTSGIREKEVIAEQGRRNSYARNALAFQTPTPEMDAFLKDRANMESEYDYGEAAALQKKQIETERAKIARDLATGDMDMATAEKYREGLDARDVVIKPSVKRVTPEDRRTKEMIPVYTDHPEGSPERRLMGYHGFDNSGKMYFTPSGTKEMPDIKRAEMGIEAYNRVMENDTEEYKDANGDVKTRRKDPATLRKEAEAARDGAFDTWDIGLGKKPAKREGVAATPEANVGARYVQPSEAGGQKPQAPPSPPPPPPVDPNTARGANPSPYAKFPSFNGMVGGRPVIADPKDAMQLEPGTEFVGPDGKTIYKVPQRKGR